MSCMNRTSFSVTLNTVRLPSAPLPSFYTVKKIHTCKYFLEMYLVLNFSRKRSRTWHTFQIQTCPCIDHRYGRQIRPSDVRCTKAMKKYIDVEYFLVHTYLHTRRLYHICKKYI